MQTVEIKNHDYSGPTTNPHQQVMDRLNQQFAHVRGPEGLRRALKTWGLTDDISPRQARMWADMNEGQRRTLCRMANTPQDYVGREWASIPQKFRPKIWQAIGDLAAWGERLKGRF
ncbi:hypothetical protein [Marinobacter sp. LN3S78]|uniref:hypothetical protein n=1 Tax=Marinobacter sp. LN3S78 TaxID=3382300 RepID=UPI00387B38B3